MNKFICIIFTFILIIPVLISCGKKKIPPMVDMDTIKTDGSHDDKYIFQKEIDKEDRREKKYKKKRILVPPE